MISVRSPTCFSFVRLLTQKPSIVRFSDFFPSWNRGEKRSVPDLQLHPGHRVQQFLWHVLHEQQQQQPKKKTVNPLKWMESSPAYICIIDLASFDSLLSALELSKSGLAIMCKFQSISASYINQMKQNRVAPLRPLTDFHGQNERSRPHPVRPYKSL